MENSSLPFIDKDDPRLKLQVENRIKNIFVTQLEDATRSEDENVNHIAVITETSSRILETGVNTLQRTLVLKKQVKVDEVDRQLAQKREEFKGRMQILAQRKADLEVKQQAMKDRANKFEKFVEDNEVKRRRALKKYQAARKESGLRQREMEDLTEQLETLQARQQYLKERVTKYKIYEDYMLKILDFLPENYLDYGADSLAMPIIRRHETLFLTYQDLVGRLARLVEELDHGQRHLEGLRQEHSTGKLMANRELSELQTQWDRAKEKNKEREMNLHMHQGQSRDQVEEAGSLLIAVKNLGEQCHFHHYGPLEGMDMSMMMDMIKEFILDKADTVKRATRVMDSGSALTSVTALSDRRQKGSGRMSKNITSKTQLKSTSKISGKSGLSSR